MLMYGLDNRLFCNEDISCYGLRSFLNNVFTRLKINEFQVPDGVSNHIHC